MNVLDIEPGFRVRIKQTFRDFDGRTHLVGTELTLASRESFPYDGGHTLRFTDGTVIRLAEIDPGCDPVLSDRAGTFFERLA